MAAYKKAQAIGSGTADPVQSAATVNPIPTPVLANKPAPGQKGPAGMSPRTTYSRVNTGQPPVSTLGDQQKSSPIRGLEQLPAKVASSREVPMSTMKTRPTSLQDMVKQAMQGAAHKVAVNLEAARQLAATEDDQVKEASAPSLAVGHVATETVIKLANALGFIADQVIKEAEFPLKGAESGPADGPGKGPGALHVMEATSTGSGIEAGQSGSATPAHQVPKSPSTQVEQVQVGKANTGLETNDDMQHAEQPVEPIKNEKTGSALVQVNLQRLRKMAGVKELAGKAVGFAKDHKQGLSTAALGATSAGAGYAAGRLHQFVKQHEKGKSKEGAAPIAFIRKLAEDAINPAQISSPANVDPVKPPEGATASEEGGLSEPSDVNSQKSMISSNQAAINYTKGQAKADPKKDLADILTEPALSAAHDSVLRQSFDNTGAAGVKISSAQGAGMAKTAHQVGAQRLLISRLIKQASEESKKKKTAVGMAPSTPQAATGMNASTMGM